MLTNHHSKHRNPFMRYTYFVELPTIILRGKRNLGR